ncbi:MAG: M28 family peptidase [Pseudohongiellaceae bacterium]|nr:M28 family peptidase [Pseudohongiellaceae bacterium]
MDYRLFQGRQRLICRFIPFLLWGLSSACLAQSTSDAWFGLETPPSFAPHTLPALVGSRGPAPATHPQSESQFTELQGDQIWPDLVEIVEISKRSRANKEIGSGQLWGRISGFDSGEETTRWAANKLREAGIEDVRLQSFTQAEDAEFWLPLSWELRLKANPAFGANSQDIILETAMPLSPSNIEGGKLSAQLVYAGTGSPAELANLDLQGKIAVQKVVPQGHMVFERTPTVPRMRAMFEQGAVAVINIMQLPGNELATDFRNCGGPCFNIGGRDGAFLEKVLSEASLKGLQDSVTVEATLETQIFTGLSAVNGVGVLPGSESDETIIINAHVDAWFDGAGDNGDGLAVQIALARHFAKPENRTKRTLVFVASAGHHTSGLNGPRNFVALNPELASKSVLALNIEHVAQRNFVPARSQASDGYRDFVADVGEAPIVAGITNSAPFLEGLIESGVALYGTNFVSEANTMASGEGGGYRSLEAPIVTTMQAPPLYHTSGEVLEAISEPGLERMARFLAYFIKQVDAAPRSAISP